MELQDGLKAARVAVLDNLLDSDDDDDDDDDDDGECAEVERPYGGSLTVFQPRTLQIATNPCPAAEDDSTSESSMPPQLEQNPLPNESVYARGSGSTAVTAFESKLQRIIDHLDLVKLAHLALFYIAQELLALRRVSAGLAMFFVAILFQMAMHRHKLMVVSMLVVCFYRSQLKEKAIKWLGQWTRTSTDKLGAFTWMPRVIVAIPVFMKVFGHVKFMLFLHQDIMLTVIVTAVSGCLVANARRAEASAQATAWGEGRRLKFAAYSTAIAYWALYRGNYLDTLRLVAPASIDAAGIVLSSVTPEEVQDVCQRAWKRLYADIADDIQQDVELDVLFVLGLGNWVIEYWQQPTDFSVEMLARMLADSFKKLEKVAVKTFRSELNHLSRQMTDMQGNSELALLVKYLKQSLENIPPPRWLGAIGLIAQKCTSFIVFSILLVFGGVVSLPLLPFLVAESRDAMHVYELHRSGELVALDGLEIWLLGSPLVRVWGNLKASIYCLEGTVTLSQAVATGTQIASTAARIRCVRGLASIASHTYETHT